MEQKAAEVSRASLTSVNAAVRLHDIKEQL
jgi:hypothetical protein